MPNSRPRPDQHGVPINPPAQRLSSRRVVRVRVAPRTQTSRRSNKTSGSFRCRRSSAVSSPSFISPSSSTIARISVRVRRAVGCNESIPASAARFSATAELYGSPASLDPIATAHAPAEAVAAARAADVAMVVVATTERIEAEGFDQSDLSLLGHHAEPVRRVAAANPRTVVVVNAGHAPSLFGLPHSSVTPRLCPAISLFNCRTLQRIGRRVRGIDLVEHKRTAQSAESLELVKL
ncbi:glycoside hydrolase family 3 C-terminal domain-containing protein [Kribbella sp. NBC_01245]|uniref:glycoside hydrolase family 3 C-terminal domain-containing protein n=1 Tax=Kribbella sp. NBC_01245 TaxID=2903578 RepID=UPI002E2DDD65|nr:glycoside hydrolase family 3 C-terminal domain-containing protein [Kribbella sp. NBC_01245]